MVRLDRTIQKPLQRLERFLLAAGRPQLDSPVKPENDEKVPDRT
jgi:hypothetical protein